MVLHFASISSIRVAEEIFPCLLKEPTSPRSDPCWILWCRFWRELAETRHYGAGPPTAFWNIYDIGQHQRRSGASLCSNGRSSRRQCPPSTFGRVTLNLVQCDPSTAMRHRTPPLRMTLATGYYARLDSRCLAPTPTSNWSSSFEHRIYILDNSLCPVPCVSSVTCISRVWLAQYYLKSTWSTRPRCLRPANSQPGSECTTVTFGPPKKGGGGGDLRTAKSRGYWPPGIARLNWRLSDRAETSKRRCWRPRRRSTGGRPFLQAKGRTLGVG